MARDKLDFGQDAPGIRLGMFAVGLGGAIAATALVLANNPLGLFRTPPVLIGLFCLVALYGFGMALYMTWGSRIGKIRTAERLLDQAGAVRPWTGAETVVDVGCGRGMMLILAARKLSTGRAIGFDVWRTEDQSGNRPEAALRNGEIAGVRQCIRVETGDARAIPLPDNSADVVTSNWVIHNIEPAAEQEKALREIWRICKPGGVIIIADIGHVAHYHATLVEWGARQPAFDNGGLEARVMNVLSFGSYRPQALICRK